MANVVEDLVNVGLGLGELLVLIAIVALVRRRLPNLRTVAVVLLVLLFAHVALFVGLAMEPPHTWNWIGKILSIAVTLAAILVIPSLSWRDAGFTWNQNGGLGAAAVAMVCTCLIAWGSKVLLVGIHVHTPDLETLLYQATMPGLNEEPLYRGVALVLLDRAFADERARILGAPMGWGGVITSIWFGLLHGNGIGQGHFQIDIPTIVIDSIIGFGLAWIRMRTQSLAMCVVTHNLLNTVQQLF